MGHFTAPALGILWTALLAVAPARAAVFPCTEQGILDAIAAGGGPHAFACGGPTVVITTAEIEIDNSVILDGEGDLTVDGGDAHRVFSVAAGVTAELRNLTVRNGSTDGSSALAYGPGAGIHNQGTLTVSNCTISDSQTGDYLGADGGGIYNAGTLTIMDSTISRNVAPPVYGQGGGIRSTGTLVLESSTVSDNFGNAGGGISARGMTTVINSTISGNSTAIGGAGIESLGTLTVTNSTLSGLHPSYPGEAILNFGTADLTNTLIEGECGGQLVSYGGNVESPGDTCSLTDATDQVGVSSSALALGPLADNGGPTETRQLGQGSAAIDAAVACPPPNEDQRGTARPEGAACDSGAFESDAVPPPPASLCPPDPLADCVVATKGRLMVDESRIRGEKLEVCLKKLTETVSQASFGDPVTGSTRYDVCVYDAANALVGGLSVDRAQEDCGSKPCWREIAGKGFRYHDSHATAHGVRRITVKSGGAANGKVLVKARNRRSAGQSSLPTGIAAALQGDSEATVQVVTSDAACFELTSTHVKRADGEVFRAFAR